MKAVVSGFKWLISTIKFLVGMVMNIITSLGYAFAYCRTLITRLIVLIGQMPSWISGFMMITLIISFIYLVIGRSGGKSD